MGYAVSFLPRLLFLRCLVPEVPIYQDPDGKEGFIILRLLSYATAFRAGFLTFLTLSSIVGRLEV